MEYTTRVLRLERVLSQEEPFSSLFRLEPGITKGIDPNSLSSLP